MGSILKSNIFMLPKSLLFIPKCSQKIQTCPNLAFFSVGSDFVSKMKRQLKSLSALISFATFMIGVKTRFSTKKFSYV